MSVQGEQENARRLGPPIGDAQAGRRLDDYLAEWFPFFSRTGWQREIKSGTVLVNALPSRKPAQRLVIGDRLSRISDISEEPEVNTALEVIWQDDDVAAVSKPAGLPMHEGGFYHRNTFVHTLPRHLGPGWAHVHRLDRETSGLVLCARSPELRAKLADGWHDATVEKVYVAVTTERPRHDEWIIDRPIHKERSLRTGLAQLSDNGAAAFTAFQLLSAGNGASLVIVRPRTGRNNQIRLHLQASGLCLVGEKAYGVDPAILDLYRQEGNSARVQSLAGFPRHALHCWRMTCKHPKTNQTITVTAPLPTDLTALCASRQIDLSGLAAIP